MKDYLVMDGRASFDMESASVMECFRKNSDDEAMKYFKQEYKGHDAVLMDEKQNIISIQG